MARYEACVYIAVEAESEEDAKSVIRNLAIDTNSPVVLGYEIDSISKEDTQ